MAKKPKVAKKAKTTTERHRQTGKSASQKKNDERRQRRDRRKQFDAVIAARERKQRRLVAVLLIGIAAVVFVSAQFSPAVPASQTGGVNLLLVFVTGITAGGLSCLAVQGGLLATAVTQREDADLEEVRLRYVSGEIDEPLVPRHDTKPVLWFLAAKITVYTLLGAGLGWLGDLVQLSPPVRAVIQIATALFMLATAMHLLRVHPIFRYVILQPPRFITRRIRRQAKSGSGFAPASLGAMTVFLPCGVTQAMMALSISSGSPLIGAATMFTFTLATSPLFFMLGYFATKLGDVVHTRFAKFAAIAIAAIAILTLDAGLRLANSPVTLAAIKDSVFSGADPVAARTADDGVQEVRVEAGAGGYSPRTVSIAAGQPARLVFVDAGGRCTLSLVFQGQLHSIVGATTIELPAQPPGEIRYSCAMGMYGGTISIVEPEEGATA